MVEFYVQKFRFQFFGKIVFRHFIFFVASLRFFCNVSLFKAIRFFGVSLFSRFRVLSCIG